MDPILVHLRLTHFPIVGMVVLLAMFIYAYFFNKSEILLACKVGFVLLSLITVPVFLSGEETEEMVEHKTGFNGEEMEEHEEHAKQAYGGMIVMGALSLISLFFRKNEKLNLRFNAFLMPVALIATLLLFIAGFHGGKIRHSEIGQTSTSQGASDMDDDD